MGVLTPSCTGKSCFSSSLPNICDGLIYILVSACDLSKFNLSECLFWSLFRSFAVLNLTRVCKNSILLINVIFF